MRLPGCFRHYDDPLSFLPQKPDGAARFVYDEQGRRRYAGVSKPPALRGVKGVWNGYKDGAGWNYSFGWPDDCRVVQEMVLYQADRQVGHLWFYESASRPELRVLFVFKSMAQNADSAGQHMGHHDFVWHGELRG